MEIGTTAIIFFLSIAKNINAKHGEIINPNITPVFTTPT